VARRIQDITEGQVLASEMPFSNFYVEGAHTYQKNGYILKLENEEYYTPTAFSIEVSDTSGRAYFLVANDYEVDVIIWTNRNGYFSGIDDNPAYNLKVDSDIFDIQLPSTADSYISFTARPNSIIGLDVQGDDGKWSYSGDRFNQIIELVGSAGDRPNGASFLAILTNPYGQFDNGRVQTIVGKRLDYNRYNQDWYMEIAAVRQVEARMPEAEDYDGVEDDIRDKVLSDLDWRILVSPQFPDGAIVTGEDTNDSNWQVSIRVYEGSTDTRYAVFVDGVLQENTVNASLVTVRNQYVDIIKARRESATDYDPTDPPQGIDFDGIGDGLQTFGIGLIVVLGLVAVIVLAR